MLSFKRKSLTKLQSPQTKPVENFLTKSNNEKEVVLPKFTCNVSEALYIARTHNTIGPENDSKVKIEHDTEPKLNVITTESEKQPKMEIKSEDQVIPTTLLTSGITIRKKINSAKTNLLGHNDDFENGSTATITRPKIDYKKNSTVGILKQSTRSNISTDRKVKFDNGHDNDDMEKPSTARKVEKLTNVPKTAIKKRIFISSKKPTNNPQ